MEDLIYDVEANGLDDATMLHSAQIGTVDGDDTTVYCDALPGYPSIAEGLARLSRARRTIGHNVVRYDHPLINRLYPGTLRREQAVDTLIMARLFDPEEREQGLGAWGRRLGNLKGDFSGPWDVVTPVMLAYAEQDVRVTRALYHKVRVVETWGQSCQLEHDTAWAIAEQVRNGFRLDVPKAQALEADLRGQTAEMAVALRDVFKPRWVRTEKETFTPKGDNRAQGYVKGCPLTKVRLETFNPGSRIQVAQRLVQLGWKPKAFGKDGHPTVDEDVLASLPYPEAQRLVSFFGLQKLLGQLADGKNGWLKLVKPNGRVYGSVNTNGAVTGRMSHAAPNMAQVASDHRMRELWIPREGWKLVGVDAEGLEARMLAHYLTPYDGGAYTRMLLEGDKKLGTDVHSVNRDAVRRAGFNVDRDGAKTLLYALMYGAQDPKLGQTVVDNLRDQGLTALGLSKNLRGLGRRVRAALATSMVGIDKLIEAIKGKVKEAGYLRSLDCRRLPVRAQHAALNTLLQGGGAVVMKKALCMFMVHQDVPGCFGLCANVHDEVQIECEPEYAQMIGHAFANCITAAGAHFNLRCPLAGDFKVGSSWAETH